jgi:hypothetical protein
LWAALPSGNERGRILLARVRIDPHWHYRDIRAVLENAHLRLIVLPEIGAMICALIDKKPDHDVSGTIPASNCADRCSARTSTTGGQRLMRCFRLATSAHTRERHILGAWCSLDWEIAAERPDGAALYLTRTTASAGAWSADFLDATPVAVPSPTD